MWPSACSAVAAGRSFGPWAAASGRSAWAGGTASQRPLVGKTVLVFLGLCVLEGLGILFSMFAWSWGLLALLWIFEKLRCSWRCWLWPSCAGSCCWAAGLWPPGT